MERTSRRGFGPQGLFLILATGVAGGQVTWIERFPVNSPSPRKGHAMAYDPARGVTVLFGGGAGWWPGAGAYSDTWEWDGTGWTLRSPPVSPAPRSWAAMVYDQARGRVVLFGGSMTNVMGSYADTWEWDGTLWIQRFPPYSPPPRHFHAMAYDSVRRRTVLFGGYDWTFIRSDTWEWDGTTWTQLLPNPSPRFRMGHAMAYDLARRRTLLYGGFSTEPILWGWDGSSWTWQGGGPIQQFTHTMAHDVARGVTVHLGGGGTSEWNGSVWTEQGPSACLPALGSGYAMVYDFFRKRMVLFDGASTAATAPSRNRTWEYGIPDSRPPSCTATCCVIGRGHCSGSLPITCPEGSRIGTNVTIAFSNPGSSAGINLLCVGSLLHPPRSLPPGPLCEAGLLHCLPVLVLPAWGDPAEFEMSIPNSPPLVGQAVTLQGASLELQGCLRLTDAIRMTIVGP